MSRFGGVKQSGFGREGSKYGKQATPAAFVTFLVADELIFTYRHRRVPDYQNCKLFIWIKLTRTIFAGCFVADMITGDPWRHGSAIARFMINDLSIISVLTIAGPRQEVDNGHDGRARSKEDNDVIDLGQIRNIRAKDH